VHAPYVTISVINSNIVPSRFLIKPSSIQFFVGAKLGGVCAQLDRIFYSFEVVSPGSPNKQEGGKIAKEVESTLGVTNHHQAFFGFLPRPVIVEH